MTTENLRLLELLTDHEEIGELLQVYGVRPSDDSKQLRNQLSQLLAQIGEEVLVSSLFELGSCFALMSNDIFNLIEEAEIGIKGQIQLAAKNEPLKSSALDSSWAFHGTVLHSVEAEDRAHALISRLSGIAATLDPEQYVKKITERRETQLGHTLRNSPNPVDRIHRRILRSAERSITEDLFNETDRNSFNVALNTITEVRAKLVTVPLSPGVTAALDEVEARCRAVVKAMDSARADESVETDPAVNALVDEILFISMRLRELAEDVADADRAEGGFRDFLKSDFWFQRWRIYELWILVRVLRTLQRIGGTVTFKRVVNGVWQLQYGRDKEPVATCEIGGRRLELFYQLYSSNDKGGDMPDIALFDQDGQALAVIDPKHGLSYSLSQVDEVLLRYSTQFGADLTAIVNYYPIPAYPFKQCQIRNRRFITASDVSPNAVSLRRLELTLEDSLLARGLASFAPIAERPQVLPKPRQPKSGTLCYIAGDEIEVDQPAGPWLVTEREGNVFSSSLHQFLGGDGEGIDGSPDGLACMIRTSQQWTLLVSGRRPRNLELSKARTILGWNSQSTHYAISGYQGVKVWERASGKSFLLRLPEGTNLTNESLGWEAGSETILLETRAGFDSPYCIYRLNLSGSLNLLYQTLHSKEDRNRSYGIHQRVIPLGPQLGTLFRTHYLGNLLIDGSDVHDWDSTKVPFSVSPSGRYRLDKSIQSRRSREGVELIRVEERDNSEVKTLPLIRFHGRITSLVKWSLDESRFAFLNRRDTGPRHSNDSILMVARVGNRYAEAASQPEQSPRDFAWLAPKLIKGG